MTFATPYHNHDDSAPPRRRRRYQHHPPSTSYHMIHRPLSHDISSPSSTMVLPTHGPGPGPSRDASARCFQQLHPINDIYTDTSRTLHTLAHREGPGSHHHLHWTVLRGGPRYWRHALPSYFTAACCDLRGFLIQRYPHLRALSVDSKASSFFSSFYWAASDPSTGSVHYFSSGLAWCYGVSSFSFGQPGARLDAGGKL